MGEEISKIPIPEFFVVYTGNERWDVSELRLSDSFLGETSENSMELVVKVVKMEYNKSEDETLEILERSEKLCGYSTLLKYIRQYRDEGYELKDAIDTAIGQCIKGGILKTFLEKNSPEVRRMLFKEISSEEFAEIRAEEAAKEFYEKGMTEGLQKGIEHLIDTYKEFKLPKEEAMKRLIEKYPMDEASALKYLENY